MKLALEALETELAVDMTNGAEVGEAAEKICEAITAIKEALFKQEQGEPVATDWERIARVQDAKLRAMCKEPKAFEQLCEIMDRYEDLRPTPPAAQPAPVQEPIGTLNIWFYKSHGNYDFEYWGSLGEGTYTVHAAKSEAPSHNSTCNETLRAQGKAYPRTCKKCGFGPCVGKPKSDTTLPATSDLLNALKRIVDEPNNTMSDGKALKEIIRIARLAIAKATGEHT